MLSLLILVPSCMLHIKHVCFPNVFRCVGAQLCLANTQQSMPLSSPLTSMHLCCKGTPPHTSESLVSLTFRTPLHTLWTGGLHVNQVRCLDSTSECPLTACHKSCMLPKNNLQAPKTRLERAVPAHIGVLCCLEAWVCYFEHGPGLEKSSVLIFRPKCDAVSFPLG